MTTTAATPTPPLNDTRWCPRTGASGARPTTTKTRPRAHQAVALAPLRAAAAASNPESDVLLPVRQARIDGNDR